MPDQMNDPEHPPLRRRACLRRDGEATADAIDILANEVPVALVYNGISHAVMMASPQDLEDFAAGFSLAEGIIEKVSELRDVERIDQPSGIELALAIPPARFANLKERRRALVGRTGCGLCGVDSLDSAIRPLPALPDGPRVAPGAVARAMAGLADGQALNRESHAVHAAGWADLAGAIVLVREDVGRHNAVDKLTGAMARAGIDPAHGFLVVTSRCSYEIVQKAATAGIRVVAAISAPTAFAASLADQANMTLIAFARGQRHTIVAHPERITA